MKIVIFTATIGRTPSGKVSEIIINGLKSKEHNILVLCAEYNIVNEEPNKVITIPYKYPLPDRLSKLLNIILRSSIRFKYWEYSSYISYRRQLKAFDPEIVYALIANGKESVLNLSLKVALYLKKPLAIHLMDPIPCPKGWETYEIYRRSRVYTIIKALRYANLISMGNSRMLEFQQDNLKFDILKKSFILPDPIDGHPCLLVKPPKKNVITYLGTFYSARKPDSLLFGFAEYHKIDKDAELHIIGKNQLNLNNYDLPDSVKSKILVLGWTSDVKRVYEYSSVLVDVDANIPDDVYISSKLKGYLLQERMIVLISRPGSPSWELLSSAKDSIITSDFDSKNICNAIERAIRMKNEADIFKDRLDLFNYLNKNRIVEDLAERLAQIA